MEIRVENVRKTFQSAEGSVTALNDISLVVPSQAVTTLLGPSGCGKTTLLRSIAGLETPDSGSISIGDTVVWANDGRQSTFVPPAKRGIGMVFQTYAIWPHMTVFDNVAYPLEAQGVRREEVAPKVRDALKFVQLDGYERRPATALSGGQQQRVSLARAIVSEPRIILFDEPLSNLDAKLREETRNDLRRLLTQLKITSLYVTHDRFEALALSDHVVVMKDGNVVQEGAPEDVYFRGNDRFVVDFIGKANFLDVEVKEVTGDRALVRSSIGPLTCEGAAGAAEGARGQAYIRMEFIRILGSGTDSADPSGGPGGPGADDSYDGDGGTDSADSSTDGDRPGVPALPHNRFTGRVTSVTFLGEYREVELAVGEATLTLRMNPISLVKEGDQLDVFLDPAGCRLLL